MTQSSAHSGPLTTQASSPSNSRRTIVAVSLGNWLEIYDFTVFSFFAVLIGKLFFPVEGEYGSLLLALATFGLGFVMRPIGSVVIGRYADRAGRKPALTLTIWLMAAGTALIGLAPTYAMIGWAAPALIILGRLLQGFSAGGEIGAATSFLMESGKRQKRGFMVSWQMASQGAAVLAGALSGTLLSTWLTPEALESWGWRVPFLLGLLIGPVGIYIRRHLDETHVASPKEAHSLGQMLRVNKRKLILGCLLITGGTANMYVAAHFMPSYMIKVLHLPPKTALLSGCAAGLILLFVSPLAGKLVDQLKRRKPLLLLLNTLTLLAIWPCFLLIQATPALSSVLVMVLIVITLITLSSPAGFLLILEAFPKHSRATGLAIIYATGVTIFGGFAQLIVAWLIKISGNLTAPAWYMLACTAVSLIALMVFPEEVVEE